MSLGWGKHLASFDKLSLSEIKTILKKSFVFNEGAATTRFSFWLLDAKSNSYHRQVYTRPRRLHGGIVDPNYEKSVSLLSGPSISVYEGLRFSRHFKGAFLNVSFSHLYKRKRTVCMIRLHIWRAYRARASFLLVIKRGAGLQSNALIMRIEGVETL